MKLKQALKLQIVFQSLFYYQQFLYEHINCPNFQVGDEINYYSALAIHKN